MRAEEDPTMTMRVRVVLSETDTEDGIKIVADYRNNTNKDLKSNLSQWDISDVIFGWSDTNKDGSAAATSLLSFGKNSVAKIDQYLVTEYSVRSGNTEYASGNWEEINKDFHFDDTQDVTLYVSLTYDKVGVDGDNTPDKVDDRTQVAYSVHLETAIDSGLYSVAQTYRVNANDDLVKLVTNGDYVNLPGWEVPAYDAEGNEYYYQYTIDGDDIYGDYVKASHSSFAKSTTNDKDTNGDGKVSCDEYYGTTGLVWSDEKNACVVESNGAVVVTIPNTATK